LLINTGLGTFAPFERYAASRRATAVAIGDLDDDGDADVVVTNYVPGGVTVLRNATVSGVPFCAGDGSGAACPCGNDSPPGSGAGCVSSLGVGGMLRGSGSARLAHDELVLTGSQMPDASALYFQGSSAVNGGAGSVFGDGLRCAGGSVLRLEIASNLAGTSSVPSASAPPLRVQGAVTAPGPVLYQVWYRNAPSFCTSATFNLTNGLRVLWQL
jgi:hypothetical protein